MIPPFIIKMVVTKVMGILVDKLQIDRMSDYVFKDNKLDKQVKVLRDELDDIKIQLIHLEKGK